MGRVPPAVASMGLSGRPPTPHARPGLGYRTMGGIGPAGWYPDPAGRAGDDACSISSTATVTRMVDIYSTAHRKAPASVLLLELRRSAGCRRGTLLYAGQPRVSLRTGPGLATGWLARVEPAAKRLAAGWRSGFGRIRTYSNRGVGPLQPSECRRRGSRCRAAHHTSHRSSRLGMYVGRSSPQ